MDIFLSLNGLVSEIWHTYRRYNPKAGEIFPHYIKVAPATVLIALMANALYKLRKVKNIPRRIIK